MQGSHSGRWITSEVIPSIAICIQAYTEHIEFDSAQCICTVRCMFAMTGPPGWPFVGTCRYNRRILPDMPRIRAMVDA